MPQQLLFQAVKIITEADDFESALQRILEVLCPATGWPEAHAYRVSGEELELMPIWFDRRWVLLEQIRRLVTNRKGEMGTPLAKAVLETAQLKSLEAGSGVEVLQGKVSPQISQALAFPVSDRQQVVAIVELFSDRKVAVSSELFDNIRLIGLLLGRVFELPELPDQENELQTTEDTASGDSSIQPGCRVLLATSHQEEFAGLLSLLKELECQVETVGSAQEALQQLPSDFDLVLMSLKLEDMDGQNAVKRIRAEDAWKNLRVVALTRQLLPDMKSRVKLAGFDGFLHTPVQREELQAQIRKASEIDSKE